MAPVLVAMAQPGDQLANDGLGMSVLDCMRQTAALFVQTLRAWPGCEIQPKPMLPPFSANLIWQNTILAAPSFRRAHVEMLEIEEHFAVVHVVISPHLHCAAPIFGFDMIAGNSQATGVFLDYSPTMARQSPLSLGQVVSRETRACFSHSRPRPAWGSIFSEEFFAIRPVNPAEILAALKLAYAALQHYLEYLTPCSQATRGPALMSAQGQEQYAIAQRKNPHTLRMLARYVGAGAARSFIDDVLFPLPGVAG